MSDAEQQHGPARRLVERAMTASDALATAINPNIPRLRFMYAPLKPHIQALEDVRAEADALDVRYAALVAAASLMLAWLDHAEYVWSDFRSETNIGKVEKQLRAALEAAKGGQDE